VRWGALEEPTQGVGRREGVILGIDELSGKPGGSIFMTFPLVCFIVSAAEGIFPEESLGKNSI
jgi:hypothetical protein